MTLESENFRKWLRIFDILTFSQIDSTNSEARRLLDAAYLNSNSIIWADDQTHGKGRLNRKWESSPGNLSFTLVFKNDPLLDRHNLMRLPFITVISLAETLKKLISPELDLKYKWPNDLLLNGKKIGGILMESAFDRANQLDWLIIGIGLNIISYPELTKFPASSLFAEGYAVASDVVLDFFLEEFVDLKSKFLVGDFDKLRNKWLENAAFIGEIIEVALNDQKITGRFSSIDKDGNIELQLHHNQIRYISYGDIFKN